MKATPDVRRCDGSALPRGVSREEAIEALWDTVKQAEDAQRRDDPSFVCWPDLDALIEHIDAHGFPPPTALCPLDEEPCDGCAGVRAPCEDVIKPQIAPMVADKGAM